MDTPASIESPLLAPLAAKYAYTLRWSPEDDAYVALCAEFPGLSWIEVDPAAALRGAAALVADVIRDLISQGEPVPVPRAMSASIAEPEGLAAPLSTLARALENTTVVGAHPHGGFFATVLAPDSSDALEVEAESPLAALGALRAELIQRAERELSTHRQRATAAEARLSALGASRL